MVVAQAFGAFHVRYYVTEIVEGKPVKKQRSHRLCAKGLYASRRGACTAIIEATGGNYAVAQAVLRHKTMDTTLRVYKKQITPQGLLAGMKQFQKSVNGEK